MCYKDKKPGAIAPGFVIWRVKYYTGQNEGAMVESPGGIIVTAGDFIT